MYGSIIIHTNTPKASFVEIIMDKKLLKMAADVMKELSLTEIKIKDGDTEIEMKREAPAEPPSKNDLVPIAEQAEQHHESDEFVDILSPLIGVFHSAPSDSEPAYVQTGSKVKKGDVLCLVESMKMLNEITSECDGTVTSIFVTDDTLVEYGNPLFRITLD